jgi:imidazolonepropionase-like amidohydrolase
MQTLMHRFSRLVMLGVMLSGSIAAGQACAPDQQPPRRIVIRNVRIVSPERRTPLENGYVVIEGDRITATGTGTPPVARGDSVVAGAGRVLIPGLIDAHTHVTAPSGLPLIVPPDLQPLATEYFEQLPRSYLYSGFTTVIDLVSVDRTLLDRLREAPAGPDIHHCGALPLVNGYPMALAASERAWDAFPDFLYDVRQKDTIPARFRPDDHTPKATVNRVAAAGGICVKTFHERGFGPVRNLPTPPLEMIQDVIGESRGRALPVVMHANAFQSWRFASDAGVDVIVHGLWNGDEVGSAGQTFSDPLRELLDTVVASRIGFMPTLRVLDGLGAMFDPAFLEDQRLTRVLPRSLVAWYGTPAGQAPAADIRREFGGASDVRIREVFRGAADRGAEIVGYLVSRGGRLVFGSDTPSGPTFGNPPGLNGYLELERLAKAGVPLDRLLAGATIEAARAFHLESHYGTVEAGKVANLLLLRANPLETVEAYDTIDVVVSRGTLHDRSSLAAR